MATKGPAARHRMLGVRYSITAFVIFLFLVILVYVKFDVSEKDGNPLPQFNVYISQDDVHVEAVKNNLPDNNSNPLLATTTSKLETNPPNMATITSKLSTTAPKLSTTVPNLATTTPNLVTTTSTSTSDITAASQSKCTYDKDVTIYMDSFMNLVNGFYGPEYREFLLKSRECPPLPGGGRCLYNYDNKHSDAIFYYGYYNDLPYIRVFDAQIVIVYTHEAESGPYCHLPSPDRYDIKVSYRRDSTVPRPFMCQNKRCQNIVEMGQPDLPSGNRKLVASFIRNCNIKWRNDYIKELMSYVHVDQWGSCLKNTPGDFHKTHYSDSGKAGDAKVDFLKKNPYKFLLSFENTNDVDYVTEKVFHGYLSRTIPIYYGNKGVFDLVPGNSTFIYANDYTPKELAKLIKRIDNDDTLYQQYFTNWDLDKMRKLDEQYCSEYFMCSVCNKVWEKLYNRKCLPA